MAINFTLSTSSESQTSRMESSSSSTASEYTATSRSPTASISSTSTPSSTSGTSSTSTSSRKHHKSSSETGISFTSTTTLSSKSTSSSGSSSVTASSEVTSSVSSKSTPTATTCVKTSDRHSKHISSIASGLSASTSSSSKDQDTSSGHIKSKHVNTTSQISRSRSIDSDETCEEVQPTSQASTRTKEHNFTSTATPKSHGGQGSELSSSSTAAMTSTSSGRHHHNKPTSTIESVGNGPSRAASNPSDSTTSASSKHKHKHTQPSSESYSSGFHSASLNSTSSGLSPTGPIGSGNSSGIGNSTVSTFPTSTKKHYHSSSLMSSETGAVGLSLGVESVGANVGNLSLGIGQSQSGSHSGNGNSTTPTKSHGSSGSITSTASRSAGTGGDVSGLGSLSATVGAGEGNSASAPQSASTFASATGSVIDSSTSSNSTSSSGYPSSSNSSSSSGDASENDGDLLGGGSENGNGVVSASAGSASAGLDSIIPSAGASVSINSNIPMSTATQVEPMSSGPTPISSSSAATSTTSNSTDTAITDVQSSLSAILGFGSEVLDTSTVPKADATGLPSTTPTENDDRARSKTSSSSHSTTTWRNGQIGSSKDSYSESSLSNNGGAIAGVAIGAIGALLVIAGLLFWYLRRRSNSKRNDKAWDSMEAGREALARQEAEHYNYGGITSETSQSGNGRGGVYGTGSPFEDVASGRNSPLRIRNGTPRQELAEAFNSRSRSNTVNGKMMERDGSKTPIMNDKDARGQKYSHTVQHQDVDPTMQAFASYFADGRQPPPGSYRTFHSEPEPISQSFVNRKPVPDSRNVDPFSDPQPQPQQILPSSFRSTSPLNMHQHFKKPSVDSIGRGIPQMGGRNSPPSLRHSNDSIGEVMGAQYIPAPNFNPNKNGGVSPPHAALMEGPSTHPVNKFNQPSKSHQSKPRFEISAGPRSHRQQASVDSKGADIIQSFNNSGEQLKNNNNNNNNGNWSPWKYQNGNNLSNFQSKPSRNQPLPPSSFSRYAQDHTAFASLSSSNYQRPTFDASRYNQTSSLPSTIPPLLSSSRILKDPFSDDYDKFA